MTGAEAPRRIRVLVAEDHYLTRLGTVTLVRTQPDMEVVAEAADGAAALTLYRRAPVDVVVADMRMPGLDGVQLTAALSKEEPPGRVLILSYYHGEEDLFRAMKAGARGYLTKNADASAFLAAVRQIHAGERYLPAELAGKLTDRMMQASLSQRELQVLELVYQGMANREIARTLNLADRTTAMYVSKVLEKLGAKSRTEAVAIALKRGLLQPR